MTELAKTTERKWARWLASEMVAARLRDAFVAVLYLVFLYFSKMWAPDFLDTIEGDHSEMFINHYMFARPWDFAGLGINTTGRWAILIWNFYWPETYWIHVLGNVFVNSVFFGFMYRWLRTQGASLPVMVLLTVILALLLARSVDARFLLLSGLVPIVLMDLRGRRTSVPLMILLVAVALSAHVKGTFLIAAVGVVLLLLATDLWRGRSPFNATFLLGAIVGWVALAGFPPSDAWAQFVQTVTSGDNYGELFAAPASLPQFAIQVVCMGAFAIAIGIANSADGPEGYLRIAFWCFLLAIVFKTSAVMGDGQHYIRWIIFLAAVCLLHAARRWSVFGPLVASIAGIKRIQWGAAVALAIGVAGALNVPSFLSLLHRKIDHKIRFAENERYHLNHVIASAFGGSQLTQTHIAAVRKVRERVPLPELQEPVGMYSDVMFTVPMAHEYDLRVLPVLALNEAWTQRSVRLNREYLRGPDVPPNMLVFANAPPDKVHLAIAEHYDLASDHGRSLLLARRPQAGQFASVLREETVFRWGETQQVPPTQEGDVLVAKFLYQPSLLAQLMGFIYRPPIVALEMLDARGGLIARQALAADFGDEGAILRPHRVESLFGVPTAATGGEMGSSIDPEATAIRFVVGRDTSADWLYGATAQRLFGPSIHVRYKVLRMVVNP